jgi:hypothetical protein
MHYGVVLKFIKQDHAREAAYRAKEDGAKVGDHLSDIWKQCPPPKVFRQVLQLGHILGHPHLLYSSNNTPPHAKNPSGSFFFLVEICS